MFQGTGQKSDENDEVDSRSDNIVIKEDVQQGISYLIKTLNKASQL
jgi:hypothetical protein